MSLSATVELFYANPSRASTALWMLEESGAPYEVRLLNLQAGDQKKPDYLAVNPMGKVPAIRHKGVVITEVAAICAYLADAFPAAGLAPPVSDPMRGTYYRWLFFAPSCIEPAVTDRALNREPGRASMMGYGDYDTTMTVAAQALSKGPYLLGEHFTAADVALGSMLDWTMMFKLTPELPEFAAYVGRLRERPAYKRAREIEQSYASSQ